MRVRLPTIFTVQTETNNDDFSTTFTAEEADQQPSCDFYLSAEQAGHRHVRPPDVCQTEAEEERRKEREKDLDNIQRMIQNHVWF